MILWQLTELSIEDAEGGYVDDIPAGVETPVGFDLSVTAPGDAPAVVTISAVVATLYRYRQEHELTGPTVARRVSLGTLEVNLVSPNATIILPDSLEADQMYQLRLDVTPAGEPPWSRTREYRAVV